LRLCVFALKIEGRCACGFATGDDPIQPALPAPLINVLDLFSFSCHSSTLPESDRATGGGGNRPRGSPRAGGRREVIRERLSSRLPEESRQRRPPRGVGSGTKRGKTGAQAQGVRKDRGFGREPFRTGASDLGRKQALDPLKAPNGGTALQGAAPKPPKPRQRRQQDPAALHDKTGRFRLTTESTHKVVQPRVPVARTRRPFLPPSGNGGLRAPRAHPPRSGPNPSSILYLRAFVPSLKTSSHVV
jgi:hypothetical protein